eukprot:127734-Amphidinium_carterae.3
MGRKFFFDPYTEKPKFEFINVKNKINWMGTPMYGGQGPCYPTSLNTQRYDDLVQDYRMSPSGRLENGDPAKDLRKRVGIRNRVEHAPLIPVAMTSKLWSTRMTDIAEDVPSILAGIPNADERDDFDMTRDGVSGLRAGTSDQDVKPPFRTMSFWRNLVRAWEMRNYEEIKSRGWNRALKWETDPHPTDMPILTQGTTMTPTVMLEERWDTWSYADLMDPEAFFGMLKKDSFGEDKLEVAQKQFKWLHIIGPLCASFSGLSVDVQRGEISFSSGWSRILSTNGH